MKVKIEITGQRSEGKSTLAHFLEEYFDTHYFKGLENCKSIVVEEGEPERMPNLEEINKCHVVIIVKPSLQGG
jgi:nicotinamide riboside kinase